MFTEQSQKIDSIGRRTTIPQAKREIRAECNTDVLSESQASSTPVSSTCLLAKLKVLILLKDY